MLSSALYAVRMNVAPLLREQLSSEAWRLLQTASEAAGRLGVPLYLVGGTVRDILLARPTRDLDLVVEGDAPILANGLAQALGGKVAARSQFGTAQIVAGELKVDVATARQERYARPGA